MQNQKVPSDSLSTYRQAGLILIPISVGELVDKLTILALKCQHLKGAGLSIAQREQALLQQALEQHAPNVPPEQVLALQEVNAALWQVEDALRAHEQRGDFNAAFVQLARRVYQLNDERHAIKQTINLQSGSELMEQKIYSGDPPITANPPLADIDLGVMASETRGVHSAAAIDAE